MALLQQESHDIKVTYENGDKVNETRVEEDNIAIDETGVQYDGAYRENVDSSIDAYIQAQPSQNVQEQSQPSHNVQEQSQPSHNVQEQSQPSLNVQEQSLPSQTGHEESQVNSEEDNHSEKGNNRTETELEDSDYVQYDSDDSDDNDDHLFDQNIDIDVENEIYDEESCSDGGGLLSSDEEMKWHNESDEENQAYPSFNTDNRYNPKFELKQLFSTKKDFRDAIHSHAIMTMRNLKITRNDERRIYAKCDSEGCDWHIHALKLKDQFSYQVRKYHPEHKCGRTFHCKNVTSSWLSQRYEELFRTDPNRSVKGFRLDIIKQIRCHISGNQAYRAKRKATATIEGNYNDQYNKLWDYANELRLQNPGSTVILKMSEEVDSEGRQKFESFYVGFKALRDGFLAGCRPFIGVDGTWLKGPHSGILLTAVGVDPNNSYYPIAYAVVWSESKATWEWFLQLLKEDLMIERDDCYTFCSDKQKGLIPAFEKVFPNADNRFCVRHLIKNMKDAKFSGDEYEKGLWAAAKASYMSDFNKKLTDFININDKLTEWLMDKPFHQWSRSHFNPYPKCDALLNNLCESFNSALLEARERPILTMLDWTRQHLMVRLQQLRDKAIKNWGNLKLCPRIIKIVEKRMMLSANCFPIKADDYNFEIHCSEGSQFVVNLRNRTCTCRRWELSGIPCMHAMSAISFMVHDPEDYVDKCYYVETFNRVYAQVIQPMNGADMWTKTGKIPPLPPNFGRKKGRPSKARRRDQDEPRKKTKLGFTSNGQGTKMKKQRFTVTCTWCGIKGHNRNGCPRKKAGEDSVNPPPTTEATENPPPTTRAPKNPPQATEAPENPPQVTEAPINPQNTTEGPSMKRKACESEGIGNGDKNGKRKAKAPTHVKGKAKAPTQDKGKAPMPSSGPNEKSDTINEKGPNVNLAPPGFHSAINTKGHAPFSAQPIPESNPFPVISKGGKKYVTLSNLPAACTSVNKDAKYAQSAKGAKEPWKLP